jgi:hypothetical protein
VKYKIQSLEEPSIRKLYMKRLDTKLKRKTGDMGIDWKAVRTAITSTAKEVLGLKNKRKLKRLKIWNEELQEAIQKKKQT